MKIKNPTHDLKTRIKMSKNWAETQRQNPSWREKEILDKLVLADVLHKFQEPAGRFVLDFAFPNKIALEIDGKGHQTDRGKKRDLIRDKILVEQGWIIIRYSIKDRGRSLYRLFRVLEQFVPTAKGIC